TRASRHGRRPRARYRAAARHEWVRAWRRRRAEIRPAALRGQQQNGAAADAAASAMPDENLRVAISGSHRAQSSGWRTVHGVLKACVQGPESAATMASNGAGRLSPLWLNANASSVQPVTSESELPGSAQTPLQRSKSGKTAPPAPAL